MVTPKKLLIFYDWFYPGFKAGGPIQSLTNLTAALITEFDILVVTSASDLNSTTTFPDIKINDWNDVLIPGSPQPVKVYYAASKTLNKSLVSRLLHETDPAIVYLNGIFSYRYFLLPLFTVKKRNGRVRVVICPRGMLKKGALSSKGFKKRLYINYLKLTGALANVFWHATTTEEAKDIAEHFPVNRGVVVAPNIPRAPFREISFISKQPGELRLVYLSLINEHKNVLLLLELVNKIEGNVTLDVYGPIVDELYWKKCESQIEQMNGKVQYRGPVDPVYVQKVLSNYQFLILLTKGENFGHAIYESMSVGRPVITSHFTPWQNLYEKQAGANVSLENQDSSMEKINEFVKMDQRDYDTFCSSAHEIATTYYQNLEARKEYLQLFSQVK